MFAKPCQLGFDPTMRRVAIPVQGKGKGKANSTEIPAEDQATDAVAQYDIAVRSCDGGKLIWFRTERLVSNIGADPSRGRGTRVWTVRKLGKNRKPVGNIGVLKDCWIDHDRKREGAILAEIRTSAQTDAQKKALDKFFLTVECHGDVYIDQDLDNTHSLLRRGQAVSNHLGAYRLQLPPPSETKPDEHLLPVGSTPLVVPIVNNETIIEYDIKQHYRIVFREFGISIDKLNSAFQIFRSLSLAAYGAYVLHCEKILIFTIGLQALHQCGWVHRDISMGNILVVGNCPKIADLEYAKRVDDDSAMHHGRTVRIRLYSVRQWI